MAEKQLRIDPYSIIANIEEAATILERLDDFLLMFYESLRVDLMEDDDDDGDADIAPGYVVRVWRDGVERRVRAVKVLDVDAMHEELGHFNDAAAALRALIVEED